MNKTQLILAFGVFGVITTEFGVIGILPSIAHTFQISMAQAGQLVSLFALVVASTAPFITLATSRFNRKIAMQTALLAFVVSNILSACATSFVMLLVARALPAFFLPVFFVNALQTAVNSVAKSEATKAVAAIYGGVSVATVAGIPLFSWLAEWFTWNVSFGAAVAINILALAALSLYIPSLSVKE
jgi:MFS transporter, DHA1 family, inner membrane transport protein